MKGFARFAAAVVVAALVGAAEARAQEVPDLRLQWRRENPGSDLPSTDVSVQVKAGVVDATWKIEGLAWRRTAEGRLFDASGDRERTMHGRFAPADAKRIAAALAAVDLDAAPAASPDPDGAKTRFRLEVGGKRLQGDCGAYPAARAFVLQVMEGLWMVESPVAPFAAVTAATFPPGAPADPSGCAVEVRVHGPLSRWAGEVVRIEGGRTTRWRLPPEEMAEVVALHAAQRLPIGLVPLPPEGHRFMLLVNVSRQGMDQNSPRTLHGGLVDQRTPSAALVRKLLSLKPPATPVAPPAPPVGRCRARPGPRPDLRDVALTRGEHPAPSDELGALP